MANLQGLGMALQGLSAGLGGRGVEFNRNMMLEQERMQEQERLAAANQAAADEKRQGTYYQDSQAALNAIMNNQPEIAYDIMSQRAEILPTILGADPSDSQSIKALFDIARSGSQGSEEAKDRIVRTLSSTVERGIGRGKLERTKGQAPIKASEVTDQGQTFSRDAQGNVVATDVAGFRGKPSGDGKDQIQSQVNALRKDITNAGKSFSQIEAARNRITKTGRKGTPASDISLIFNFMKMNDPGSTVREGEFATAQNAGGVDTTIINMYNKIREGTRLTPEQREDFIAQSEGLFSAQRDAFDSSIERTLQQSDQDGIDRARVLGKDRLAEFNERSRLRNMPAPGSNRLRFDAQGNQIQ